MAVNWIFFDQTLRLRSGWRFAVFCVAFVFAAMIIGVAVAVLLSSLSVPLEPGSATYFLANSSPMLVPAMLVGWLCGKYLEALPFRALGASFTKGWLRHLLAGILFGAGTVSVAVLIAFVFGGLRFESNVIDGRMLAGSLTIAFMVFAVGAAAEEALFRGYILQTFARSGFAALAIALTAVFFGIVHSRNPNVGNLAVINTILAGIWFGVAYLKTRDLWFVWGMHLMWNWMQGAFFGIEVSGFTDLVSAPLLKEIDVGPAWLTGESYGVEGGIVTTIALVVSTVAIYFLPWLKPSEDMLELTSAPRENRVS